MSLLLIRPGRRGFLRLSRFENLSPDRQTKRLLHLIPDLFQHQRLIFQGLFCVLAALAQAFALVRKPRAALFNAAAVRLLEKDPNDISAILATTLGQLETSLALLGLETPERM